MSVQGVKVATTGGQITKKKRTEYEGNIYPEKFADLGVQGWEEPPVHGEDFCSVLHRRSG